MSTLEVDGAKLYWEQFGQGAAVLLIPATGFATDMWGPFPRELAKSRRGIVYDRRGFNRSMASPAQHMRRHAADAAALLTHARAEPAAVLGWSGGGLVSLALAVEHPQAVESLILVEPSLHMLRHIRASLLPTMARAWYARLIRRNPQAATDILYRWVFSYSAGGSAYDRFPEEWRLELGRNSQAINKESAQEARFYPARKQVSAIRSPITCVVGEFSTYRRPSMFLAKIHPGVRVLEVHGASHALHLDDPDAFLSAIRPALP